MKKLFSVLFLVIIVSIISSSDTEVAKAGNYLNSNTPIPTNTVNVQSGPQELIKTIKPMIEDIGFWVSLLVLPLLSIVSKLRFKKDAPNQFLLVTNLCSILIILSLQIANLYFPNWIKFIACFFVAITSVYILNLKQKYNDARIALKDSNEKNCIIKAKKYLDYVMSHKLNKCIESVQLYECRIKNDRKCQILLNFAYGKARENVEINSILSSCYTVDKSIIDDFKTVLEMFNDYQDDAPSELYKKTIAQKAESNILSLKNELKKIDCIENITKEHLCIARIIVLYLTIIDALDKESTYIGFDIESLGFDSSIEKALFTKMRTGILGSILLKEYPYLFHYKKDGWKKDRLYLSFFIEGKSNNYVVLISLKKFPDKELFNTSLNRALRGIESNFRNILCNE